MLEAHDNKGRDTHEEHEIHGSTDPQHMRAPLKCLWERARNEGQNPRSQPPHRVALSQSLAAKQLNDQELT